MSRVPVLLRIAEVLGVDPEFFSEAAEELLATDLRAALGDEATGVSTSVEEAVEVARDHPEVARALVALHHRYRDAAEQVAALASAPADASVAALPPAEPHDEVRDLFYAHHNHFAPIDSEAEDAAQAWGLDSARSAADLPRQRLADQHRVTVVRAAPEHRADARRFDPVNRLLFLSP